MSAEESITEESNGTDDLSEVDDEEVAADAELVEEDLDEFGQLAKRISGMLFDDHAVAH